MKERSSDRSFDTPGLVSAEMGCGMPLIPTTPFGTKRQQTKMIMFKNLSLYNDSNLRQDIGLQRAWVFFDDKRLYPEETIERPIFPSDSFLEAESVRSAGSEDWLSHPNKARESRLKALCDETRAVRQFWNNGV
jgi:hypothetical protein